jgi:hypothetical protein
MIHGARAWLRLTLGLLLTPISVALAVQLLPPLVVSDGLAALIAFSGAVAVALSGLAVSATAIVSLRVALSIAGAAAAVLVALALWGSSSYASLVVVDSALVGLAWGLGASLGRRVQHASHLFPACVVAASADVVSLLSPEGPSHAIVRDERALSVLAMGFPVPGCSAVAPALGVGDLLFIAFVLGVAIAHGVGYGRAIGCVVAGVALAGYASARLAVAVPALVPIAAVTIVGLPGIRRLRAADRTAAHASMAIAVSLAVATMARTALGL